jgi:hypothetical protein
MPSPLAAVEEPEFLVVDLHPESHTDGGILSWVKHGNSS